jgi:hypothetical protein
MSASAMLASSSAAEAKALPPEGSGLSLLARIEIACLFLALSAMWLAPVALERLPTWGVFSRNFYGANFVALAVVGPAWLLYAPGSLLLRMVWSIAAPVALFRIAWQPSGLALSPDIYLPALLAIASGWLTVWLLMLAVYGIGQDSWPCMPAKPARESPWWQFGVSDLLLVMIPLALLFTAALSLPIRFEEPSGFAWPMVLLFVLGAVLLHGVPVVMVASLATWSAPLGIGPSLLALLLAAVVFTIYGILLSGTRGGPLFEPFLMFAHFYAFVWCSARLLFLVREATMVDTTVPAGAATTPGERLP